VSRWRRSVSSPVPLAATKSTKPSTVTRYATAIVIVAACGARYRMNMGMDAFESMFAKAKAAPARHSL
jgi:hypothetical protein